MFVSCLPDVLYLYAVIGDVFLCTVYMNVVMSMWHGWPRTACGYVCFKSNKKTKSFVQKSFVLIKSLSTWGDVFFQQKKTKKPNKKGINIFVTFSTAQAINVQFLNWEDKLQIGKPTSHAIRKGLKPQSTSKTLVWGGIRTSVHRGKRHENKPDTLLTKSSFGATQKINPQEFKNWGKILKEDFLFIQQLDSEWLVFSMMLSNCLKVCMIPFTKIPKKGLLGL